MTAPIRQGMGMEYVYVIGGVLLVCLFGFFRYLLMHCSQTYHPAVHLMRPNALNPNLHVVPRSSYPYTISGAISTYSHVSPAEPTSTNNLYAPLYTLPASTVLPSDVLTPLAGATLHGRQRRIRIAPRTTWTSHGPPDYETVMAATHTNRAFILEEEALPPPTPPPSYESVMESMGAPPPRTQ